MCVNNVHYILHITIMHEGDVCPRISYNTQLRRFFIKNNMVFSGVVVSETSLEGFEVTLGGVNFW